MNTDRQAERVRQTNRQTGMHAKKYKMRPTVLGQTSSQAHEQVDRMGTKTDLRRRAVPVKQTSDAAMGVLAISFS